MDVVQPAVGLIGAMTSQLPAHIRATLEAMLEGVSRNELAERSARMTASYRKTGTVIFRDHRDVLAYAVARMPATYAAVSAALKATVQRLETWRPRSLLDLGSGPGTAIWAALEAIEGLQTVTAIERNASMQELATELGAAPGHIQRYDDIADAKTVLPASELVIAAYVLGELPSGAQADLIARAWMATAGVLVLVEPGTPAGAERINLARSQLIAVGAHLVAPCPHALACPMPPPDWCHFPVRVARSRAHKAVKGADVPFEDEKFAYLAVSRTPVPELRRIGRVVGPPVASKPAIGLTVCQDGRLDQLHIPSRDGLAYAAVRKLRWGDCCDLGWD